jgi:hypothetical protein
VTPPHVECWMPEIEASPLDRPSCQSDQQASRQQHF